MLPPVQKLNSRWRRAARATFLLGLIVAESAYARESPPQREQRIFGYTDAAGTTMLTNVPENPPAAVRYTLLVDLHESQGTAPGVLTAGAHRRVPVSSELRHWVEEASRAQRLEPALVYAVMATESGYNPQAVSPKGALGLMQLTPETSQNYGVKNPFDSRESIFAGTQHLRRLLDQFRGNLPLALAAYNAGSNAVIRYHNEIPPFAETQAYVPRVLDTYERLRFAAP